MQTAPDPSLDEGTRELAIRLDRLLQELAQVRTACVELARALKAAQGRQRPARQAGARRSRPLEAAELEARGCPASRGI